MTSCTVRVTFVQIARHIGLRGPTDSHGPRLHEFRHRCAAHTLLRWYQEGADVEQHLPELSTCLGHESMDTTQIYLYASLELKERALEKTTPINKHPGRYRPDDDLMAFLKGI